MEQLTPAQQARGQDIEMNQLSESLRHIVTMESLRCRRVLEHDHEDARALQEGIVRRVWDIMARDKGNSQ